MPDPDPPPALSGAGELSPRSSGMQRLRSASRHDSSGKGLGAGRMHPGRPRPPKRTPQPSPSIRLNALLAGKQLRVSGG